MSDVADEPAEEETGVGADISMLLRWFSDMMLLFLSFFLLLLNAPRILSRSEKLVADSREGLSKAAQFGHVDAERNL